MRTRSLNCWRDSGCSRLTGGTQTIDRIHAMPLFLGGGYPSMAPCFYGPVLLEELWICVLRHWWIRDCLENGGHVWKIASPAFH